MVSPHTDKQHCMNSNKTHSSQASTSLFQRIKGPFASAFLGVMGIAALPHMAAGQATVISDNFNTSTGATYDTDGSIGSSSTWSLSRSGVDWGARIDGNILDLSNDASATGNAGGWVFGYTDVNAISGWNSTLSSNTGVVTWEFNMRSNRANLAGFTGTNYGMAYVLSSTSASANSTGSGYAITLGNGSTPDPFRLISFNNGLAGTQTTLITSNTAGFTNIGTNYHSIRVTYNPSTNQWELFVRDDGSTSFADPAVGTLISQGTAVNSTYTSTSGMRYVGAYWAGSTGANQTAFFDNVTLKVAAPAATILGAATATAFTSTYGTPSAAQSFPISGTTLTTDIVATSPPGFEVSSDGTNFGPTATFAQTSGSASGTLRIRLAATAAVTGTYNAQTITLTSTGAATVNITTSASGNSVTAKSLTITGLTAQNKNWDATTDATVTGTAEYAGLANSETFAVTGTVTWAFADANVGTDKTLVRTGNYLAPSTNYSVTQPTLTASILGVVPPAPTITEITAGNQQLSVAFTAPANNGGVAISNYEYSLNGGTNWITPAPSVTSSPLLIPSLTNGATYDVQLRAVNAIGSGAASTTVQGTPVAPSSATISVTPAILGGPLSSTYGVASSLQNLTVSGSVLSGNLTVTAPAGLELSLETNGVFSDQLTLTADSGSVSPTAVYVRLKASAPAGGYNGLNIVVSGGGATSQSAATTPAGNTQATKTLTITGLSAANKEYNATPDASVTGTAEFSGLENGDSFTPSGLVTWAFADKTIGDAKPLVRTGDYAAPSANYTVTQPTLSANITAKNLTVTGALVTTRPYNATATATLVGATLSGVIGLDVVTLTNDTSGVFAQANVGQDISVSTTMGLTGADSGNYTITQPTLTGTIVKADQVITFGVLAARSVTDAPFNLVATSTSGLTVSFANSNPAVATLEGTTVTIAGLGSTTLSASQAGDNNYNEAVAVERVLIVTPVPLLWSFTGATTGAAASTPSNITPSLFTGGNNNGTVTFINSTSPSTTSLGFSGTNNAGAAARTGVLNTATNGSAYFEFSVTPTSGFKATLTDISFGSRSTGTGPQAYSIRSSADNYATDVLTGTLGADSTWALKSHTGLTLDFDAARTYRIYGHSGVGSASANTVNWRVDDIRLLINVVEKTTPAITTAPTASTITIGQTLASSTLSGGAASVAGTFAFTTPTIAPALGTSSQSVTFTPTDTLNNKTVTLSVDVTTNRNTPTITTAPTATAITVGQTLASSTLTGGVASVSGTFAFTNPSTAPSQGTSAQSVTFTPTDSTNNNSVILNVNVTVNAVVTEDPLFTDPTKNAVLSDVAGGAKRLTFSGIPGRVYGIERSGTLTGWTQINTVTAPENGMVTFDDPNPLPGSGFYRIVYPAAN
jgi:hypothetical protein